MEKHTISFSIDKKLIVLVMISSITAITASAYLSYYSATEILQERMVEQLTSESTLRGHSTLSFIHTRIKDTQILATDPMIQNLVEELNNITYDSNYYATIKEKRRDFLIEIQAFEEFVGFSIGFEDVKIIGKEGRVFFSLVRLKETDDFSHDSKFLEGLSRPFAIFESAKDGGSKMVVITPIYGKENNSEPIGVIIAKMRTDELNEILLNRSGLGETGEVYIVNEDLLMISQSRFIENAAFNQKVDTLPVRACFKNQKNVSEKYLDYRGISVYGLSFCAKDLGFVLVAEIDEHETLQPIFNLQENIIYVGIFITIAMMGLAFILSKLISRPITQLKNATNEIAQGNFDIRTNIKTRDEIGQLSSSFDIMTKKLQESMIAINLREEIIKQQENILLSFSQKSQNCCVCIIDIIQSTIATANLSDKQTEKFYGLFINSFAEIIKKFNGIIVKNIGDSILFYFPKIESGDTSALKNVLDCCLSISEYNLEINKKFAQEGLPKIDYRTSITYGTVNIAKIATSSVDDIFGATVNRCAKINRFALPNNVIVGSDVYENIKSLSDYNFRNMNVNPVGTKAIYSVYLVTRKSD